MAAAEASQSQLNDTQRELLLQYQEITATEDVDASSRVLERHNWNLEAAVQSTFSRNEGIPSAYDNIEEDEYKESNQDENQTRPESSTKSSYAPGSSAVDVHRRNTWLSWLGGLALMPFNAVHSGSSFCYHCISKFIVFVVRIIFPRFARPLTDPVDDILNFKHNYESKYGTVHPTFYQGSYSQVLRDCKNELRFLLVYLHRRDHSDADRFCRNIISHPGFSEYINGNMLFWACDVDSNEGYRVSNAMRERSYPFLAIVCLRENKMCIVWRIEGYVDVDQAIAICAQVIDENEPGLVATRAERLERTVTQELRCEQDAAYLKSLAEDRQKEAEKQKKREEIKRQEELKIQKKLEKQKTIEALKLKRQLCRDFISKCTEPTPTDVGCIQIRVKLPNGIQLQRYFLKNDLMQSLYDFVFSHEDSPAEFLLSSNYPRRSFPLKNNENKTLDACGICSSSAMFIQNLDESSDEED